MALQTITIVGGGLAGLSLGIALRRDGIEVRLIDSGAYPRHRVCGEFISGRGLEILARLEVLPVLQRAGGREASTARFYWKDRSLPEQRLPQKALCISRFFLDAALLDVYTALGGTLALGERWVESFNLPGVVRATGRRLAGPSQAARWFGLKAHARGVSLESDLEMHVGARGYVGVCRVEGDRVNVCGLFREPAEASTRRNPLELFCSGMGNPLRQRLAAASWDDDSRCAVAGLPIHVGLRTDRGEVGECAIGDAVAMIPPLTGNGMSMALESAWLAKEPLGRFARGEIEWKACCREVAKLHDDRFRSRLVWANRLHRFLIGDGSWARRWVGWGMHWSPAWKWAFRVSR